MFKREKSQEAIPEKTDRVGHLGSKLDISMLIFQESFEDKLVQESF